MGCAHPITKKLLRHFSFIRILYIRNTWLEIGKKNNALLQNICEDSAVLGLNLRIFESQTAKNLKALRNSYKKKKVWNDLLLNSLLLCNWKVANFELRVFLSIISTPKSDVIFILGKVKTPVFALSSGISEHHFI